MDPKTKLLIAALALTLMGASAYYLYKPKSKSSKPKTESESAEPVAETTAPAETEQPVEVSPSIKCLKRLIKNWLKRQKHWEMIFMRKKIF